MQYGALGEYFVMSSPVHDDMNSSAHVDRWKSLINGSYGLHRAQSAVLSESSVADAASDTRGTGHDHYGGGQFSRLGVHGGGVV